jgi:hypothetical protein
MDATNHSDHKALGTTISNIWFTEQKNIYPVSFYARAPGETTYK